MTLIQLPAGSTQGETQAVIDKVYNYYQTQEKITSLRCLLSTALALPVKGKTWDLAFVRLNDWEERPRDATTAQNIAKKAMGYFMTQINEAQVYAIAPPAIQGLGTATGFDLQLQDSGNVGHQGLLDARNMLLGMTAQSKEVVGVRPNGQEDAPQYKINIDYDRANSLWV